MSHPTILAYIELLTFTNNDTWNIKENKPRPLLQWTGVFSVFLHTNALECNGNEHGNTTEKVTTEWWGYLTGTSNIHYLPEPTSSGDLQLES